MPYSRDCKKAELICEETDRKYYLPLIFTGDFNVKFALENLEPPTNVIRDSLFKLAKNNDTIPTTKVVAINVIKLATQYIFKVLPNLKFR